VGVILIGWKDDTAVASCVVLLGPACAGVNLTQASAYAEKRYQINDVRVSTDPRVKPEDDGREPRSRVILSAGWCYVLIGQE
jgi:hypothetical protein